MSLPVENIEAFQSQLLFIEDMLITKAVNNTSGLSQFVTYKEAPGVFKVVDQCKDQPPNSFFGCIVMVCGYSKLNIIEKFNFHKLDGFQIVGYAPGTTKVSMMSKG